MNNDKIAFATFTKSISLSINKKSLSDDEILAITYKSLKLSPDKDYAIGHILSAFENISLLHVFAVEKSLVKKLAREKNAGFIFPFWAVYKSPSAKTCCLISEFENEKFLACYSNNKLILSFSIDEFSWQSVNFKINEIGREYGIFFDEIYTTKTELSNYFTLVCGVFADLEELEFLNLYKQDKRFGDKSRLLLSAILGAILGGAVTTFEYLSHEYNKNLHELNTNRNLLISEKSKLKDLSLKIEELTAQKDALIKSKELPSLEVSDKNNKSEILGKIILLAKQTGVKISNISIDKHTMTLNAASNEYSKISSFITLILDDFTIVSAKNEVFENGFGVSIKARKKYAK